MPTVNIGERTALDSSNKFIQLKAKDEKVKFRIINTSYSYDGKHFLKDEKGNWDIQYCPRIMENKTCPLCEKFSEAKRQAKELKNENKEVTKELENTIKTYNPKITFYYAILNRETQLAQILKTVLTFRLFIDNEREQGVDVLKYDYIIQRTEKPGNYYAFTRIDSAMSKPLTEEEEKQVEIGKKWNIEEEVVSKKTSHPLTGSDDELVDLNEVPF